MSLFGFLKHKDKAESSENPFDPGLPPKQSVSDSPPLSEELPVPDMVTPTRSQPESTILTNESVDEIQELLTKPAVVTLADAPSDFSQALTNPDLSSLDLVAPESTSPPHHHSGTKQHRHHAHPSATKQELSSQEQVSSQAYTEEKDYVDLVADAVYISKRRYANLLWDVFQLKKQLEMDYDSIPSTEVKEVQQIQDAIQAHASMQAVLTEIDNKITQGKRQ